MTKKKEKRFIIPNCDNLEIYKQAQSKKWYCRFYVGRHVSKSGNVVRSTQTEVQQLAIKIAKEMWRDYFFTNPNMSTDSPINLYVFKDSTYLRLFIYLLFAGE